jgi:hypothetical protein
MENRLRCRNTCVELTTIRNPESIDLLGMIHECQLCRHRLSTLLSSVGTTRSALPIILILDPHRERGDRISSSVIRRSRGVLLCRCSLVPAV